MLLRWNTTEPVLRQNCWSQDFQKSRNVWPPHPHLFRCQPNQAYTHFFIVQQAPSSLRHVRCIDPNRYWWPVVLWTFGGISCCCVSNRRILTHQDRVRLDLQRNRGLLRTDDDCFLKSEVLSHQNLYESWLAGKTQSCTTSASTFFQLSTKPSLGWPLFRSAGATDPSRPLFRLGPKCALIDFFLAQQLPIYLRHIEPARQHGPMMTSCALHLDGYCFDSVCTFALLSPPK